MSSLDDDFNEQPGEGWFAPTSRLFVAQERSFRKLEWHLSPGLSRAYEVFTIFFLYMTINWDMGTYGSVYGNNI